MKHIFISICILLSLNCIAQSPEKLVPADADNVISINLASLSQKINFNDLSNYSFLKNNTNDNIVSSKSFIKELFRMPEKAGLNTKGKILLFSENHDSTSNFTYIISLSNSKSFKSRVSEILKPTKDAIKFTKTGKYEIYNYNHSLSISCSKNTAIISIWQRPYYYSYSDEELYNQARYKIIAIIDSIRYAKIENQTETKPDTAKEYQIFENDEQLIDNDSVEAVEIIETQTNYYEYDYNNDSLMKQFERNWQAKQKETENKFWERQDLKMTQNHLRLFSLKSDAQMANDEGFLNVYKQNNDFTLWIPVNNFSKKIVPMFSKKNKYYVTPPDTSKTKEKTEETKPDKLAELLGNNKFYGLGNFEKGKIVMDFNFECNDKLKPYIEKIYHSNINPDFFDYIKSDNLMGLACVSINTEAWADFYVELFRRAIESNSKPDKKISVGLELADLLINRDVFFHTFRGDGVLAFTGMKSYLKTYNSWEYDSITFESRTVQKTKTQYIPEFVYILTVENQTNLNKIISLLNRLEALKENEKNIWTLNTGKSEIDSNFFIVTKDNLFFITNDRKLAKEQIHGGLRSQRVVANTYSSYLSTAAFGFWDASVMFKLMAENNDGKDLGNSAFLNKLGEKINNGFYYAKPLKNNISETQVTIELKNRENSSLLEILNLFDDLYKIK